MSDRDLKHAAALLAAERLAQSTAQQEQGRDRKSTEISGAAEPTVHPSVEEFVAYHASELSDVRADEVQAHLSVCRSCGDLVLELHRVEAEERRPWTMLTEWLARLFDPLRPAEGHPGGVAVTAGRRQLVQWGWAVQLGAAAILLIGFASFFTVKLATPGDPLGRYGMELHGAIKATRGPDVVVAPGEPYEFAPGMTFDLNLYPTASVKGKVEIKAFYLSDSASPQDWRVPVEVSEEGSVRIRGLVGKDIVLPAGESTVVVAVGRPGRIPVAEELQRRLANTDAVEERDWTAWTFRVRIVDGATSQ